MCPCVKQLLTNKAHAVGWRIEQCVGNLHCNLHCFNSCVGQVGLCYHMWLRKPSFELPLRKCNLNTVQGADEYVLGWWFWIFFTKRKHITTRSDSGSELLLARWYCHVNMIYVWEIISYILATFLITLTISSTSFCHKHTASVQTHGLNYCCSWLRLWWWWWCSKVWEESVLLKTPWNQNGSVAAC